MCRLLLVRFRYGLVQHYFLPHQMSFSILEAAGATGTAVIDSFDLADSFKIKLSSSKSLEILKPVSQLKSRQILV